MRVIGRIALFGLALVGLVAGIVALAFWATGPGDPLDRTRVVAVVPNSSGQEPAVLYLHHAANYSTDILAVKLVRPPFPALDSTIRPAGNVIAVAGGRISGWRQSTDAAAVRQLIDISWSGKGADALDVCPADEAKLIALNTRYDGDDREHVTLCRKAMK